MTAAVIDPEAPPAARPRLPLVRWTLLTVLLLVEAGALSAAYDAAQRGRDPGWAGTVVAWTPAIFRWGLVAAGLAVVLAFWLLRADLWAALRSPYPPRRLAIAIVGQLAAYALFALSTSRVLGQVEPLEPWQLLVWLAAGGLTVGIWALAMLPPRVWPKLIWEGRNIWLLAALVAAITSVAARATRDEWDVLSEPTMRSACGLLRMVLPDVVYDQEKRLLGTKGFLVEVGVPCSGYEGIGLMAIYLIVYLTLFRRDLRFPRAFLLVPLALVAVWVANVLRLVALVYIGDRISPSLAVGGFHSQAGWVGFNAVAVGLLMLAHRSRLFTRTTAVGHSGPDATLAYLAPLLAVIVVQMVAIAVSTRPAMLYPLRAIVGAVLLWYFWPRFTVLRTSGREAGSLGLMWTLVAGGGVFLLWVVLVPPIATSARQTLGDWPDWAFGLWGIARVIGFVIVTPLVEELAFRGYLMRRLVSADFESVPPGRFTWPSLLISSVLFGLMHGEILAGILAGLAYGLVVIRSGRVRDAVIAHAITNGLLMAVLFVTGGWAE